jgi:chemotaxis protein MotB
VSSVLLSGCVSRGKYDDLQGQYTTLQRQYTTLQGQYGDLQGQYKQLQQSSAAQAQQSAAELAAAKKEATAEKTQVGRFQEAIKFTLNSDLLFRPGSWEISPRGKDLIAKMAPKLAPYQQNKLVVNGYTDNAPISPALKREGVASNEVLSQKRAEAVMQNLISNGVKPDMISARGFGDANPIASNKTAKGRAQNRRVEVTLAGQTSS